MNKHIQRWAIFTISILLLLSNPIHSYSNTVLDEANKVLQKSLTVYELDQEIARLNTQQMEISKQMENTSVELAAKTEQVQQTRQHSDKVVRAYYMGDRGSFWMLLFSAKSFSDALVIFDYLSMIVQHDQKLLAKYKSAYQELSQVQTLLEKSRTELSRVKNDLITQRDKAVTLQNEIDAQLLASSNAEALKRQMEQLTRSWQDQGVPLFQRYLQSISDVVQLLPEWIGSVGSSKAFTGSLLSPVFQMTDTELNTFFRSKNPIFSNISFEFADGQLLAQGRDGDHKMSMKGHYTIVNIPTHKLQFQIDELAFNGFVLPETTNRSLEKQFDLGFLPETFGPLQATEISLEAGKLKMKLKYKLR